MRLDPKIENLLDEYSKYARPAKKILFWRPTKRTVGSVKTNDYTIFINKTGEYYSFSWADLDEDGLNISHEANFTVVNDIMHFIRLVSYRTDDSSQRFSITEMSEEHDSQEVMQDKFITMLKL